MLWRDQPGFPPSGLEANAPLWYAPGFTNALAAERRRADRQDAAAWALVRTLAARRVEG